MNVSAQDVIVKKDGSTVTAECKDGTCTFSDGTTVNESDCNACQECQAGTAK